MEPDRRPVVYATFAWLVAAGALVAIVAFHTSTPPDILGEEAGGAPAAEPAGEPVPEPAVPNQTAPEPDADVTVPQDTNHTFNGSVRSASVGSGERSFAFSTEAAEGSVGVTVVFSDSRPENTTTFPGQKADVRFELYRNGTLLASGFVNPAAWGEEGRIAGFVDGQAMDWEVRVAYDWPSDFDFSVHVDVDYPD